MSEMIGKVSLQEKIAELESRVAALEKGRIDGLRQAKAECDAAWKGTTLYEHMSTVSSKSFGEHWDKMWDEFHAVMKGVFKRG